MEYLLILNTFRIPRSSLDIQDGIYEKTVPSSVMVGMATFETDVLISRGLPGSEPEPGLRKDS